MYIEIIIVLILIGINGFLAMSELAVVSARRTTTGRHGCGRQPQSLGRTSADCETRPLSIRGSDRNHHGRNRNRRLQRRNHRQTPGSASVRRWIVRWGGRDSRLWNRGTIITYLSGNRRRVGAQADRVAQRRAHSSVGRHTHEAPCPRIPAARERPGRIGTLILK